MNIWNNTNNTNWDVFSVQNTHWISDFAQKKMQKSIINVLNNNYVFK